MRDNNLILSLGLVTSEYPHPKVNNAAGIATSIKNLAVSLTKKGVRVTVFVYNQDNDGIFNSDGVEIHLIKSNNYPVLGWYLYRKKINKYINKIIALNKLDIIEAPDWTGIAAFMKFKIPLIIRFHGSDAYFCKLDNRKQKLKNFLFEKNAIKRAKAYIAPTTFAGKVTSEIFNIEKNKIKTIHYGLELENFENKTPELFNRNTILYIGTIIRKKGVLELAQIFNEVIKRNPKAKLILIGNDSPDLITGATSTFGLVKNLLSKEAVNHVNYLGKIPYNEVIEHIKNAHVCVFPSFAETLGMVTIESMALKKPVANTSIGWAQELIDDGVNGFLVHPNNIVEYASKICNLLDDESLCLKIGKEARKKVENSFDINKNADINISYYKSIIA